MPALQARFHQPAAVLADPTTGDIYVADTINDAVRKIAYADPKHTVTTVAGEVASAGSNDGIGSAAHFLTPTALAWNRGDPGTRQILVADTGNHRVRMIDLASSAVTTIAGWNFGDDDGPGSPASGAAPAVFAYPSGVAAASDGRIFAISSPGRGMKIKQIGADSQRTVVSLTEGGTGYTDGPGTSAKLRAQAGLVWDGVALYVADPGNQRMRKLVRERERDPGDHLRREREGRQRGRPRQRGELRTSVGHVPRSRHRHALPRRRHRLHPLAPTLMLDRNPDREHDLTPDPDRVRPPSTFDCRLSTQSAKRPGSEGRMRSLDRLRQNYDEDQEVVFQDKRSPPRLIFSDTEILLEELPVGTRVVFPNPPIEPLANWRAAIRWAINHPEGCDPLHAQLRPGMKVVVALDDISLPLPPMRTPDVRQIALEIVLQLLADSGVTDVHLLIANALHRRMTPAEMERMVGPKIFAAYYPDRYTNHDAEEPGAIVELGETEAKEKVRISRRATEADLVIYLNVNFVPMDGGHKSVGTGLTDYLGLRAHHTPQAIRDSKSYMEPRHSALHSSVDRIGRVIDRHLNVFHIETALNNKMFDGPMGFLGKREEDFTEIDRLALAGLRTMLQKTPRSLRQRIFHKVPAGYGLIAVAAGRTEPAHEKVLEACRRQCFVKVKGQSDILIAGIPYISPYNVNSILNPLLVQVMACGYFFNMNRGIPLVKKGGTLILTHPCMDEFDPVQHPSYIEFFHRLLPETTDALELHRKYEREFAQNPSYVHLYRKGNAYHGAHPFYMWYWGENGRAHLGQVIAVGTENTHVPQLLGWERADTLAEAIDLARGRQGRTAEITLMHHPPMVMAEVGVSAEEATRLLGEPEAKPRGGAGHKPGIAAKGEP